MPHYFFNVSDDQNFIDRLGLELPDVKAARHEAVRAAGQALADRAKVYAAGQDWTMKVLNERGVQLFRLDFRLTQMAELTGSLASYMLPCGSQGLADAKESDAG